MITNHDLTKAKEYGKSSVKIVLMSLDFKANFTVTVLGNIAGFRLFEYAIYSLAGELLKNNDFIHFYLENNKGEKLYLVDEENKYEEFLKKFVVQMTVLSIGE